MSTKRTYIIKNKTSVVIQTIKKSELDSCLQNLVEMIQEKLTRLRPFLEGCTISWMNSSMIIKDQLGIQNDLAEMMKEYGFTIDEMENNQNQGKTYLITDEIIQMLQLFLSNHHVANISLSTFIDNLVIEKQTNIPKHIFDKMINFKINNLINDQTFDKMIHAAYRNEQITVNQIQQIERYEDGRSDKIINTTVMDHEYKASINNFNETISYINIKHKQNMIKGTTKSIEVQAKKMGYHVKKNVTNSQVELVMVRER